LKFTIGNGKRKKLMADENILSGLKVVDLASFIAGPGAATILSDFGAEVIKIEPPDGELWRNGHKIPPQPHREVPHPFQLANRNKRGAAFNLKATSAQQVLERLAKWADVFIVNTPHSARKKLKLEYDREKRRCAVLRAQSIRSVSQKMSKG
jgi:crotonobetainyl-CoA:carnitine CoA-transferase CaiB-like acyl-CoA transferase